MKQFTALSAVLLLICTSSLLAQDGKAISQMISAAKSGETVQLPAGTFDIGDLSVPANVSVKGAGYDKTILNSAGFGDGMVVRDSKGASIADLTIRGATSTALSVQGGSEIHIERVRLLNSATGLIVDNATSVRVENAVVAGNRVGVVLSRNKTLALVNSTVSDNAALAISVTANHGGAFFNNLFINSQTGIYLTKDNENVAIDYNLYVASFTGKFVGEPTRTSVESWSDITQQDRHSISMTVEFADAKAGAYRPTSGLSWSATRATTSDWGAKELAGVQAAAKDIDGHDRVGDVDLGAYEVALTPSRSADGEFVVPAAEVGSVTSAGLYTKDGRNVVFLFQNLPLHEGKYAFWIPSRNFTGEPISTGDYELRLVQSNLSLEYIAATGNTGKTNTLADLASIDPQIVFFDEKDNVVLVQGGFENDQHVRSFDPAFDKNRWVLNGGGNAVGATRDAKGNLFVMRLADDTGKINLIKLDAETGKGVDIENGSFAKIIEGVFSGKVRGMTQLNGMLFVSDEGKNKVFVSAAEGSISFDKSFDAPAPTQIAADTERGLLWMISGGQKLIAVDSNGAVKHEATPVPAPCALAIQNGKMAIASSQDRKIHVFDCTDPATLKPLMTIGKGDDIHGPLLPNRFFGARSLAVNSKGEVASVDGNHVALFDAEGKPRGYQMAVWGQHVSHGKFANDDREHFFDIAGHYSFALDAKSRKWEPGTWYDVPENLTGGRSIHGVFPSNGKTYGIYSGQIKAHTMLAIVRFDDAKVRPLIAYSFDDDAKGLVSRVDTTADGIIDEKDAPTPLENADGSIIPEDLINARPRMKADGSLITSGNIVAFKGVDGAGVPTYDWAGRTKLRYFVNNEDGSFTSPFDFKKPESAATAQDYALLPDGGVAAIIKLGSGGGPGFNGGGTDMAGFDASGKMRWFHPLNPPGRSLGLVGMQALPGVLLTARGSENEFTAVDPDGLGLGILGPTPEFQWQGMWLDHNEQYRAFVGNDGKPYIVTGDYYSQAYHWQALIGSDKIHRATVPVSIDAPKAAALAALPAVPYPSAPKPNTVRVTVRKLTAPLAIDGDPKKWRAAGIAPQIVVTPETGHGIGGPDDCSAVIRLAYEGNNLYVQVIKFDDVVTMHQPLKFHYKQDSTEMCINGFMSGFKFNVTKTREYGPTVFRDRFLFPDLELVLDPAKAPRVINVLDNARDIDERKLIESTYGVDLSNSKVIITEFKLPLDYAWSPEKCPLKIESGGTFWLGFFIDDNDTPGLDVQNLLAWPATFQAYGNPEQGAQAVFE